MIGTIFMDGQTQAVRLPKALYVPGTRVRITRSGNGILLTPIIEDLQEWFAAMDRSHDGAIFEDEIEEPPMPSDKNLFD